MKTYNFSKEELEYLSPVEATKQALDTAIQVFIINVVMKRLGIPSDQPVRYDTRLGTLTLIEKDPPPTAKEEAKVEEAPVEEPKSEEVKA